MRGGLLTAFCGLQAINDIGARISRTAKVFFIGFSFGWRFGCARRRVTKAEKAFSGGQESPLPVKLPASKEA
jgi:hypothetical protein